MALFSISDSCLPGSGGPGHALAFSMPLTAMMHLTGKVRWAIRKK